MLDVFLDALLDSLKVLPFLVLIYIIIELFEEKTVNFFKNKHTRGLGPLLGSGFGLVPQCGFGVVTTKLYSKKFITIGTLIAIYIATSDEAIPMMIANIRDGKRVLDLLLFIGIKVGYAIIVGYTLDLIFRKRELNQTEDIKDDETDVGCCHHEIKEEKKWKEVILHPILHSLKLFAYIFVVNLLFGFMIYAIGEENIINFMNTNKYLQPLFAAIVGLIPNCAASVLITEMYLTKGLLCFAAAVAGLVANSGIAMTVLFKENKNIKENISIIGILFISGLLIGYLLLLIL